MPHKELIKRAGYLLPAIVNRVADVMEELFKMTLPHSRADYLSLRCSKCGDKRMKAIGAAIRQI